MELYIKELFQILQPIKENYELLENSVSEDKQRIQNLKNNCSLTILSAFSGTSLSFNKTTTNSYQIQWKNRVKYFKNNKKDILILLQNIISIIHKTDKMKVVDITLDKETKQIKLLIENDNIEIKR
jgi:hypothetical protein